MSNSLIYPRLSDVLPIDNIPDQLDGVRQALESIFGNLYAKDIHLYTSPDGSSGHYSLKIVFLTQLGINLPFLGGDDSMKLVVNPTAVGTTEVAVSVDYNWKIIRYVKQFTLDSFDNTLVTLFQILFELAEITPQDLLRNVIVTFIPEVNAVETLINKINNDYNTVISYDPNALEEDQLQSLADSIESYDLDIIDVIIKSYIEGNGFSEGVTRLKKLFSDIVDNVEDNIKELIKLHFQATISDLSLGLRFPRKWLTPVNTGQDPNLELDEPLPEPYHSYLTFDVGTLNYSSDSGLKFYKENSFNLNRSMIGNTGLIAEFEQLKIDLSSDSNIPEAIIDGRPDNFKGVYAKRAAIALPSKWFKNVNNTTLQIYGNDLLVGTGGISGTIGLEAINGTPVASDNYLYANMEGWSIGFNSFDITFKQSDIVSSNIKAQLVLEKFKDSSNNAARIDVTGHLDADGDFLLTAAAVPPFDPKITLPGVFTLHLKSVELGKEDGKLFIGASADVEFVDDLLGGLLKGQTLSISALRIYSDGHIDFRVNGGNMTLPKPIKLPIGPVDVSVTAIHFGSHEREKGGVIRKYNYFGFDGGVSIGVAGIDARGDGIKFYYTVDDGPRDSYLHIQTIHVDMIIPANSSDPTVSIKGWLSIPEPGEFQEYKGGVSLKVKNPRITGGVDMRLAPKYPAFLIDAHIELPNPIALGPVSIYGFRGLLGYRYVAEKAAIGMTSDNTWYQYYTAPERGVGVDKFSRPDKTEDYNFPFSLGVGALLGDTMANGNIISANAMLLLSLPSMVMVDARMKLLSSRVTYQDDPPFFAFFIFGDNSLEFGFGADYKFPESSGDIIKLYAEIQAGFFFNNPSAWYINFGTKQAPITASLLKNLFTLKAFLMISGKGIEAGARGEFRFDRKFGPIKIFVLAYLELGGKISFQKPQMGAYFEAGLTIDIDVKIIRIYASVTILLAVESPEPFLIYGAFSVAFKIKILFFKLSFSAKIELKWEFNKTVRRDPVNPFTEIPGQSESLVKGVSMLTNETFDLQQVADPQAYPAVSTITKVVPLDTYIDIKSTKGLIPSLAANEIIGGYTSAAGNAVDLIPPDKVMKGLELRQVKHQYTLESIEISAYKEHPHTDPVTGAVISAGWIQYNPFKAMDPGNTYLDAAKAGQWQKKDNQYNAIRILGMTPFSYTEQGNPGWFIPEQYGVMPSTLFCEGQDIDDSVSDFLDKPLNTQYYASSNSFFQSKGASYQISGDVQYTVDIYGNPVMQGDSGKVSDAVNMHGFDQSLEFKNTSHLTIMLPAPSQKVELKLSTYSTGLKIQYFSPLIDDSQSFVQYDMDEIYYSKAELSDRVVVPEPIASKGITKIVIIPDVTDSVQINLIQEQMAVLMQQGYQQALSQGGYVGQVQPSNWQQYMSLQSQLEKYQSVGCDGARRDKEEAMCKYYPDILGHYNNNFFVPFKRRGGAATGLEYADFIRKRLDTGVFHSMLSSLQSYGIGSAIFTIYLSQYAKLLDALSEYVASNPDDISGIIERFEKMKSKFRQVERLSLDMNPCTDSRLCNLSTELSTKEFGLFNDRTGLSQSPLFDAYNAFVANTPGYSYLRNLLARQISTISTVLLGGWTMYVTNIGAYNQACEDIISILKDLGNCSSNKKCFTLFHEVKWLSVEDYEFNLSIPSQEAIEAQTQAAVDAITHSVQPIWRPDTAYYVKFTLQDKVDNTVQQPYHYGYAFRTAGPLGFFHLDRNATYGDIEIKNPDGSVHILEDTTGVLRDTGGNTIEQQTAHPDQYPHTSLRAYIDYQRSYPNADGNLVNAKPLFYQDDTTEISMYFTSSYVSKLLDGWHEYKGLKPLGGTMKIIIKDPVEGISVVNPPYIDATEQFIETSPSEISQTFEEWLTDDNPAIPPVLSQYANMLNNGQSCIGDITLTTPKSIYRVARPKKLKPQKLYTAQVLNLYWGDEPGVDLMNITEELKQKYAKEVHKFVFQTSRYKNFEEQVKSCFIGYEGENGLAGIRQAVYSIEKSIAPNKLTAAWDIIRTKPKEVCTNSLSKAIETQYQHPFDRIVQGLFGITPQEDAPTTEFNKITDSDTGQVVAVLIRNPEPFNHPKIPVEEVVTVHTLATPPVVTQEGMIEVVNFNSSGKPVLNSDYKVIYSKDYSQALVMNTAKSITATELNFKFIYKVWDGTKYKKSSTVIAENIKINS
ncbi:hypothetical protein ODZ84_07050 [Chryseobacterium fluminis]|uniref:hypothetical protein n=1 Tax=Chryseobacterium fluminis TaxID=2983606 RepID=UPI00225A2C4D|nr:hypothetical protein [Chryseobacterium sp. MMS21-Ot14]UZT99322.1 hypothetical protein ODZ84_07050 [Chryseobacterium sp. MMS21-Ot14]